MKFLFPLVAALAIAPACFAQAPCADYQKLADAQLKGFETIKTGKGDSRFFIETSLQIAGAGECSMSEPPKGDSYSCIREFDTEAKARTAASAVLAELKSCFIGWTARTRTTFPESFDPNHRMLADAFLTRPPPSEEPGLHIGLSSAIEKGRTAYFVHISMDSLRVKPSQLLDTSERGFCTTLNRIIAESASGFAAFKGAVRGAKPETFDARFSLSGEEDCSVDLSSGSAYRCTRRENSKFGAMLLHDERSVLMKACLSGWKEEALPESALAGADRRLTGFRFTGAGANSGVEITLFVDKRELPKSNVAFDTTTTILRRTK